MRRFEECVSRLCNECVVTVVHPDKLMSVSWFVTWRFKKSGEIGIHNEFDRLTSDFDDKRGCPDRFSVRTKDPDDEVRRCKKDAEIKGNA